VRKRLEAHGKPRRRAIEQAVAVRHPVKTARWSYAVLACTVLVATMAGFTHASIERRSISTGGALLVIDAATGKTTWSKQPMKPRLVQLAGAGPSLIVANDSPCTDKAPTHGRLVAFEAATGAPRWSRPAIPIATKSMVWSASPTSDVAAGGVIVTPGGRGGFEATGLAARTGRQVWEVQGESFLGVSDQFVFTVGNGGDHPVLVAHDRRSGRQRWTFPASASPQWTATFDVVAADRAHVVVGNGNYLARYGDHPGSSTTFFVIDTRRGEQTASFTAADPSFSFSDMVLADGALVYAEGTSLVARDITTGSTRWTHNFEGAVGTPGATGVYARTTNGRKQVLAEIHGSDSARVVALDIRTGETSWEVPRAFVRSGGERHSLLGRPDAQGLVGIKTQTGKKLWERTIPSTVGGRYASISTDVNDGRLAVAEVCDLG
jgi:outer membrane protein assembly factor BamB